MSEASQLSQHSFAISMNEISLPKQKKYKNEKWVAKTDRSANLMAQARRLAVIQHAQIELRKSSKSIRKPTRAITPRQKSSKRSAEICRAKNDIYVSLLENEIEKETQQKENHRRMLFLQHEENAKLAARIAAIEAEKAIAQVNTNDDHVSSCSFVSSDLTCLIPESHDAEDTALEQCPEWILEGDQGAEVALSFELPGQESVMITSDYVHPWLESPVSEVSTSTFSEYSALIDDSFSLRI